MAWPHSLHYIIWNASPEIFRIEGVGAIRWYGFMWALGLILSRQIGLYIFHRDNRYTEHLHILFLYIVLPAVIGARLGHFLFYDPVQFVKNPLNIVLPPYHGMASHGGVLGILIGVYVFCKKYKHDFLWVADRLSIVACIPGATIRLGNLFNSEIIGRPTDVPWAFVFARVDQVPRHPAQLYEAMFCTFLFFLLFYIWRSWSAKIGSGFLLGLLMIGAWGFRFVDELLKENQMRFEDSMPLNMGQLLSIFFILFGALLIVYSSRGQKKSDSAE